MDIHEQLVVDSGVEKGSGRVKRFLRPRSGRVAKGRVKRGTGDGGRPCRQPMMVSETANSDSQKHRCTMSAGGCRKDKGTQSRLMYAIHNDIVMPLQMEYLFHSRWRER